MNLTQKTLLILLVFSPLAIAQDERPSAPRLLPSGTLGYFRIDNVDEFKELFGKSSAGRMMNDPQVRPLVSGVYTGISGLLDQVSQQVGVSLDEVLSIPQGEFSIAMIEVDPEAKLKRIREARENETSDEEEFDEDDDSPEAIRARLNRRRQQNQMEARLSFGMVLIVDAKEKSSIIQRLLDRAEQGMLSRGFQKRTDTEQNVDIVTIERPNRPQSLSYFIHQGTAVIGSDPTPVRNILLRWKDKLDDDRLSGNGNFTTVMSHCVGAEATRPQITFYVDPFRIIDRATTFGGAAGMAAFVINNLGLEGIKGIGGSSFMAGEEFDSITHVHLLLDSRRNGVLSVIRPKEGPITPPDWAPADSTGIITLNWDFDKSVSSVRRLYNQIRGEGSFKEDVLDKASQRFQIDIEEDFLAQMSGRISMVTWMEPPARLGSDVTVFGAELKDPDVMEKTLGSIMDTFPNWTSKTHAGVKLYSGPDRRLPEEMRKYVRVGQPHVAVVGNDLVYTDSRPLLEKIIATQQGGGSGRVKNLPEYDLIAGELTGQLDGRSPFMFGFSRPEESLRTIYELLKSPQMRQGLRELAQANPVAKMFHEALEANELPPLSVFTQYLTPTGSFAYNDTSGLHMASFSLGAD